VQRVVLAAVMLVLANATMPDWRPVCPCRSDAAITRPYEPKWNPLMKRVSSSIC
jgi:hypothetical protein